MSAGSSLFSDFHIYSINADGSGLEQLTNGPGVDDDAAYSANGRRIIFERMPIGLNGQSDLYTMAADGTDVRRLTSTSGAIETWGSFSPSGRRVVFERRRPGCSDCVDSAIFTMNGGGSNLRRLTAFGRGTQPEFAPNGRHIVFTRGHRVKRPGGRRQFETAIWAMRPDGSHKRAITPWLKGPPGVGQYSPDYSPRGRRVVYESILDCVSDCVIVLSSIRTDGTGVHLFHSKRYGATYAPAGDRFAYRRGNDIYTLSLTGHEQTRVTDHKTQGFATVDIRPGAWQPTHP